MGRLERKEVIENRSPRRSNGAHVQWQALSILIPLIFLVSNVYAAPVSSKELIDNAKLLDGKTVQYKGELVTAILNRGEYSWANLNDGDNAIGVWCKSSLLKPVRFIGDYKNKGDVLEVTGIFNRACSVHRGELDIHASSIKIVKPGFSVKEQTGRRKPGVSMAIFLVVLSMAIIFRKRL